MKVYLRIKNRGFVDADHPNHRWNTTRNQIEPMRKRRMIENDEAKGGVVKIVI